MCSAPIFVYAPTGLDLGGFDDHLAGPGFSFLGLGTKPPEQAIGD